MTSLKENFFDQKIYALLVTFLALCLQIQITLFQEGNYLGLRVNLADLFLPGIGLYVLYSLFSKKSKWPIFENKLMLPALALIVLALTISLVNSYFSLGYWSSWAVLNKYIGFFVLLSYFALGAWIKTNCKFPDQAELKYIKSHIYFFLAVVLASIIFVLLQQFTDKEIWLDRFPWDGFAANRNVFMIFAIFSLFALETYNKFSKDYFPDWVMYAFWIVMPLFALYNASRSGWIIGGFFLLYVLFIKPKHFILKIIPLLAVGFVLMFGVFNYLAIGEVTEGQEVTLLKEALMAQHEDELKYYGDQKRYIAVEDGLEMYAQSGNPVFGAGLGVYKDFQIEKRGEFIDIMDFSLLWLLSETGIFGVLAFSIFFLLALKTLFVEGYKNQNPYHQTIFIFLIAMILISVLHELLYTRLLWFVLGIGLAVPVSIKSRQPVN